jgi:hypothetical protein
MRAGYSEWLWTEWACQPGPPRRLLRAARTVAGLAEAEKTGPRALAEALSYRAIELGSPSGAEPPEAAANRSTAALRVHRGV